ncbi:hypothetical protein [Kribbella sp. NPDC004875]|uniref:hypothetical protein n=1 Tax=Kribbella sp. NPDC004875 TaxID=3364107 RepID=UPI00368C74DF
MVESSASRRELLDSLVGQISRETAASAGLLPEDRVLARQRMQQAIEGAAVQARADIAALAFGDQQGPEADRFFDYLDKSYRQQRDAELAGPDSEPSPARKLAAAIVASDDRLNGFAPDLKRRAEFYIAHSVTVAAEAQTRKTSGGPSQAPAAAAAGAAAGPAAASVAAVKAGVPTTRGTIPPPQR